MYTNIINSINNYAISHHEIYFHEFKYYLKNMNIDLIAKIYHEVKSRQLDALVFYINEEYQLY